jgi:5-methylcytosine-specific restriction protein A
VTRHQRWTADELILALDLYFRLPRTRVLKGHPEIGRLSVLLNKRNDRLRAKNSTQYRSENSVYNKVIGFVHLDPTYYPTGPVRRRGRLEEVIWNGFADDHALLRRTAREVAVQIDALWVRDRKAEYDKGRWGVAR